MNAQINRRCLLSLAPAALAVGAAPAMAMQVAETPVMRAYREWEAADADLQHPKWDERSNEDQDAACALLSAMMDEILAIPALNARDFIMKVMACTCMGENGLPDERQDPQLWAEARALIA